MKIRHFTTENLLRAPHPGRGETQHSYVWSREPVIFIPPGRLGVLLGCIGVYSPWHLEPLENTLLHAECSVKVWQLTKCISYKNQKELLFQDSFRWHLQRSFGTDLSRISHRAFFHFIALLSRGLIFSLSRALLYTEALSILVTCETLWKYCK